MVIETTRVEAHGNTINVLLEENIPWIPCNLGISILLVTCVNLSSQRRITLTCLIINSPFTTSTSCTYLLLALQYIHHYRYKSSFMTWVCHSNIIDHYIWVTHEVNMVKTSNKNKNKKPPIDKSLHWKDSARG